MEFINILAGLGFIVWAVIIVGLVAIMVGVENEKYGISTAALVITALVLLYLLGGSIGGAFTYVTTNPAGVIKTIFAYIGIGIVYGFVKWFFFLFGIRDRLVTFRNNYEIKGALTDKERSEFWDQNRSVLRMPYGENSIPPRVSRNKSRVTFWMAYWPFSLPWTLLNEPVKRLFNFIYYRIAGVMQNMSNRLFKGLA